MLCARVMRGDIARAQRTRDVSVGVQYEHFPPDARNTYGISVSIPLFLGNDYRGDIARSEAEHTAAEQQLAATQAYASSEQARLRAEYAARAAENSAKPFFAGPPTSCDAICTVRSAVTARDPEPGQASARG